MLIICFVAFSIMCLCQLSFKNLNKFDVWRPQRCWWCFISLRQNQISRKRTGNRVC